MPAGTAAEYERCASRRERRMRNGQSRKAAEAEVAKVRGAFRKHIAADRDDESAILAEALGRDKASRPGASSRARGSRSGSTRSTRPARRSPRRLLHAPSVRSSYVHEDNYH